MRLLITYCKCRHGLHSRQVVRNLHKQVPNVPAYVMLLPLFWKLLTRWYYGFLCGRYPVTEKIQFKIRRNMNTYIHCEYMYQIDVASTDMHPYHCLWLKDKT